MIRVPPKVIAALVSVAAMVSTAAVPAATAHTQSPAHAVVAKSCSDGYKRGVINGHVKCLRRGEFCTHSADRQYRRYGFRCTRWYRNVHRYRLT